MTRPKSRRFLAVATAIALAATGTAVATGTAQASPPPSPAPSSQRLTVADLSATDQGRIAQQRPLVAAATVIRAEVERHSYPGYTGLELKDTHVVLWWKGPVPQRIREVVAQAAKDAPVRVRAAKHSMSEMRTAAAKLPTAGVDSVKLTVDGSGLIVGRHAAAAQSRLALPDVGVPVTTTTEAALQPVSRDDDWSPWKGGATIVNATRSTACTAGFGVRDSRGASYLLTAGHCGQVGDRFQDAQGEFIGNVGARNQDHDIELVPTNNVDGYVYLGKRDSNLIGFVGGWGWTFVGEYLCQSGTTSAGVIGGPVCNLKVLFFYADKEDLVEAEQTQGQTAVRSGDSGGPVYSISGDGKLIAKGTNTRGAGSRLGFQDFGTAWRDFNITPVTR